ncbi:MAG: periplasmic heavy metal sensor [Bacteroidetes bacterium]|nr:periplasmic heavy metal sensor [Bacteroidota bacterium]
MKNKLLTWLVVLLLVANAATIAFFWLGRTKQPPGLQGSAARDFLVKELNLDAKQQEQFSEMVKEHRNSADQIRPQIRKAKEALFDLLKQPGVSDSLKLAAAKQVSVQTEALDLLTFDHFQKLRSICNPAQQQKFDAVIHDIIRTMGQPRPPMRPGDRPGPPSGEGPVENRPPPSGEGPGENRPPPPGE